MDGSTLKTYADTDIFHSAIDQMQKSNIRVNTTESAFIPNLTMKTT